MYLYVYKVFYTLKSTDNFFDCCVHFAKISAIQTEKLTG